MVCFFTDLFNETPRQREGLKIQDIPTRRDRSSQLSSPNSPSAKPKVSQPAQVMQGHETAKKKASRNRVARADSQRKAEKKQQGKKESQISGIAYTRMNEL